MDTLPLRIKVIRALNILSAILLIFVTAMLIYSLIGLNKGNADIIKDNVALSQKMATMNKMAYFVIPLDVILGLFLLW